MKTKDKSKWAGTNEQVGGYPQLEAKLFARKIRVRYITQKTHNVWVKDILRPKRRFGGSGMKMHSPQA